MRQAAACSAINLVESFRAVLAFSEPARNVCGMQCRLARGIVVALLATVTGGHWALFQTAAWVGMTLDYSQTDSLAGALKKTFDGKHPCKLCRLISSEKKSEQKKETRLLIDKPDFFFSSANPSLFPPPFVQPSAEGAPLLSRQEGPPRPLPRQLPG